MDESAERRFNMRIESLPPWMRITVDSVARQLLTVGAYNGSETDSVTDALAILHNIFPETGYNEVTP